MRRARLRTSESKGHATRQTRDQQAALLPISRRQQREDKTVVVRFAGGQRETDRQPTGIDDRMNPGRQSAARPAHQLFNITSDAGSMLVHSH